ncbi:RNA polymerase sigma factor [Streptomyces sp. Act143]|uniref:RNA polymerase sigma factor n=1 Tax=Streptomyces sp. Act143 TaxID=2200760 RepID=UPI0026D96F6C
MDTREWRDTIAAAQAGDRRALDELVAGWLPLVHNIVGRALNGHADVDDVVQETMLRAVGNLGALRDPDSFRSWLVAISVRQIRHRARRRTAAAPRDDSAAEGFADFPELTVLRIHLEGRRREVAEAVRWLDDEDRHLLSLCWLEVAGELTRREPAAAAGSAGSTPPCASSGSGNGWRPPSASSAPSTAPAPGLRDLTTRWGGRPDSVRRKRLARRIRGCGYCDGGPTLTRAGRAGRRGRRCGWW